MKPRYYQQEAVDSFFDFFAAGNIGNPLIAMPTGCHAKGQKVLMFDGSLKSVENIIVGDLLMGPDSKPRKVLSLARGRQEMREIVPVKGKPWIVNKDHILALYKTRQGNCGRACCQSGYIIQTVRDYESSNKWHKHLHKLYRVSVEFPKGEKLTVDPYFMGLFLGDGNYTNSGVNITSMDLETLKFCKFYMLSVGNLTRESNNGSLASCIHSTTTVKNRTRRTILAHKLDDLGLRGCNSGTKFIPHCYKVSTKQNRLEILAGLIDSDGHLSCGGYEITSKSEKLAEDISFIARSLGFAAYSKPCVKSSQNGTKGNYFRVFISGNIVEIPVRLERKLASIREQKKNHLVTGFKVNKLPVDNYYGFELDGDHLYLLDDFTVTHNTGKSLVMALLVMEIFKRYRGQRILLATHVKNLIENNYNTLLKVWPNAPAGIYSAGLDRKDVGFPITYAGIGSIHKKAHIFQKIDILMIDEAHLLSDKDSTMYRRFIEDLKRYNPYLIVVGLTATPFRTGQGMLTNEGGLFTHFCYDITGIEPFNRLLGEGFLCPLVPQKTDVELDVENLRLVKGEFSIVEMEQRYNVDKKTIEALEEAIVKGYHKKHWLIFATGTDHCDRIAKLLNEKYNIPTVAVHSKLPKKQRDRNFHLFTTGQVRAAVNNNCLTTGIDYPDVDLCIGLRPTNIPGLWVQILGRFIRPVWPCVYKIPDSQGNMNNWHLWPQGYVASGRYDLDTIKGRLLCIREGPKPNALILDFAANTKRLGPINDPNIPYPRKKGAKPRLAPVKICDNCGMYNHASVRICSNCGYEFPRQIKIMSEAANEELIRTQEIRIEIFKVDNVSYDLHQKAGKADQVVVIYQVGLLSYRKWVALEHPEPTAHKAREWWRKASRGLEQGLEVPTTTAEALTRTDELFFPSHIRVRIDTQYPQVLDVDYTGTAFGSLESGSSDDPF